MSILQEENFKKKYGKAKYVLELPENSFYLNLLEECYSNEKYFNFIILANNLLKVPPTKSFLLLYEDKIREKENGNIENYALKQAIGAYWGYIFSNVLNMKNTKKARVGILGVSTATVFSYQSEKGESKMSEAEKQKEIMDFLDEKVFNPALNIGKEQKNQTIIKGVNITKARMSRLSSEKMVQYFWSAIIGTENSIRFSEILKENGVNRFEDIYEEFRVKFNDEWLKK